MTVRISVLVMLVIGVMVSVAEPVRSMLGAKGGGVIAEESGWENPYITDGLVAMWDGEWNVGPGRHSANATTWKDLVGYGGDMVNRIQSHLMSFGSNYWISDAKNKGFVSTPTFDTLSCLTIEIIVEIETGSGQSYPCIFFSNRYNAWSEGNFQFAGLFNSSLRRLVFTTRKSTIINRSSLPIQNSQSEITAYYNVTSYPCRLWSSHLISGPIKKDNFFIGAPSGAAWCGVINCKVFCIRLYDRALTEDEIASNRAVDEERFGL